MRILMLGNSFTMYNHMPDMLAKLLDAEVFVNARGGARLAEQLNIGTKLGTQVAQIMQEKPFDYVVLQEMSHGPATETGRYLENIRKLATRAKAKGAVPVIYATWAFHPSCKRLEKLGMDPDEMHERMQAVFRDAAENNDALMANVGEVFKERGFADELYADDGRHPSEKGSKIAAEVIAETIREHYDTMMQQK